MALRRTEKEAESRLSSGKWVLKRFQKVSRSDSGAAALGERRAEIEPLEGWGFEDLRATARPSSMAGHGSEPTIRCGHPPHSAPGGARQRAILGLHRAPWAIHCSSEWISATRLEQTDQASEHQEPLKEEELKEFQELRTELEE